MGRGYTLGCRKCRFRVTANLGIGYTFPIVYKGIMEAARSGNFGETIRQFLEEHPDGALNGEWVFLQCPDCGWLEKGIDLSMYIRNPEVSRRKQKRRFFTGSFETAEFVTPMELKEGDAYQFYSLGNHCRKCGKTMNPINLEDMDEQERGSWKDRRQTGIKCPKCGERLWIEDEYMWD